ncbi:MAG: response regulator [Desulfarculales bacterium]|jgi:two-component system chemotaxis response regulator CheY|nr:response regulator [Desulfarculales bacterium]
MSNKTILIVDDSATLRMSVEMTLNPLGYNIVQAVNGKDGLQTLDDLDAHGQVPDMIISDINMPVMGGIEFIKEVKNTKFRYLPILVLTTEREESKKREGQQAGASGWLVKPFQPQTLIAVVKKFTRTLS